MRIFRHSVFLWVFLLKSVLILHSQDVVINKVFNGGRNIADTVELLVVKDNLNMRGMMIRDFTPQLSDNASGAYIFQNNAQWQSVKAGTLLVCFNGGNVPARIADTVWTISFGNPTYFQPSDTLKDFDLADQDMVMIKSPNTPIRGTSGSIHAFAYGLRDSASVQAIQKKLWLPATRTGAEVNLTPSGNGVYAYATSTTASIRDFNGTGTGFTDIWRTGAGTGFGRGNTPNNQRYIEELRGSRTTGVISLPPYIFTSVFPNPASEQVTVRIGSAYTPKTLSQKATISCYTSIGTLVNQGTVAVKYIDRNVIQNSDLVRELQYPCSDLPPGVYFLDIQFEGDGRERCSFVKAQ